MKSTTIDVEEVGGDEIDDIERRRTSASRSLLSRRYKIQEVIKKRQILLVQVAKEERGNKGAALTTYLSLAGRYCVLMPNAVRGGGISRKITSQEDRKRLKSILAELQVPTRMGVIVRTAGTERSKAEIRRDFEYLIRQWEKIRELTLNSIAPVIIYEEGNLIKRSIRDLYTRDVEQILVDGDEGYRIAKDFMRMLIPSHTSKVQPYRERTPLFSKYKIETQLDSMYSHEVKLKSGGSLVINSTEALVAIDVNSGKATRERNIEETAVKTNIEAASEVARQLRLRDLAGLIVVDFIDMEGTRNQRSVERKLKEGMRVDRARIQIGRISPFGLLELSRQRLRPSITESSMEVCDVCEGTGIVRSIGSSAVHVLRAIEEEGLRNLSSAIQVSVPAKVAYYILNRKRSELAEIERICKFSVDFAESTGLIAPMYQITRLKSKNTDSNEVIKVPENISETSNTEIDNNDSETNKRRRRRRKPRNTVPAKNTVSEVEAETIKDKVDINLDTKIEKDESDPDSDSTSSPKRRRRGKRGGRRRPTNSIIEGNDSINNPTSINSDQPTQSENLKNKNMSKNTQPPKTNSIIKNDKSNSKVIANDEKEKDKIKPAPKRRVPTQTKNKQKNSEKVVSKPSPKKEGSKKPIVKQDETLINGEDTSVKKPKIEEKQPARRGWWNKGSKAE